MVSNTRYLDGVDLAGERLNVAFARSERRERDDHGQRDRREKEIVLYRVGISNLSSDTTWQVCAFCSDLGDVPVTA